MSTIWRKSDCTQNARDIDLQRKETNDEPACNERRRQGTRGSLSGRVRTIWSVMAFPCATDSRAPVLDERRGSVSHAPGLSGAAVFSADRAIRSAWGNIRTGDLKRSRSCIKARSRTVTRLEMRGVIGPGDVQWMTAASGIVHEELHEKEFAAHGWHTGGRFSCGSNLPKCVRKCRSLGIKRW